MRANTVAEAAGFLLAAVQSRSFNTRSLMRLVVAIALLARLLFLGWEVPFREQLPESIAHFVAPARTSTAPIRHAASNSSGTWMWDPNHKSVLDRPAYHQARSFSNYITYFEVEAIGWM